MKAFVEPATLFGLVRFPGLKALQTFNDKTILVEKQKWFF